MKKSLRRLSLGLVTAGVGLNLWGCSGGGVGVIDGISTSEANPNLPAVLPTPVVKFTTPKFDPASGNPANIPLPNDLLRNPQTGLVDQNIPNTPPFNAEPFTSLKSIRGFSTTGNIVIPFVGGVVPSSVNSNSIRVLDTTTNATVNCTYTVLNPLQEAKETSSTVVATPVRPLAPNRTYSVVITPELQGSGGSVQPTQIINFIKEATPLVDGNGKSRLTVLSDAQAAQLEALRAPYQAIWTRAETASGISRSNMVFAFQFGTQPLLQPMTTLRAQAATDNRGFVNTTVLAQDTQFNNQANTPTNVTAFYTAAAPGGLGLPAPAAAAAIGGVRRVCTGQILIPDYIGNPLTGFFDGEGFTGLTPITRKSDKPYRFWALLPDPGLFPGARPCVVFQHGITRNRNDVFAIAGALTSAGFGVVAIDMPLHGDNKLPGQTDGTGYINLASLRTSRDNLRQSAANLFWISQAIVSNQSSVDGTAGSEFTTDPPAYVGQSLGAIVGTIYSAVDPNNRRAVLNVPGGRLSTLLLNSPTFGPTILAGQAAQGLTPGTDSFLQFWLIAQTVLDDAEPLNYANVLQSGALKGSANLASRVLVQQAMGDIVVPNSATEDLANALLPSQAQPFVDRYSLLTLVNLPFAGTGLFQFPNTKHGFLLSATEGNIVGAQFQAVNFLASGSIVLPVPFPKAEEGTAVQTADPASSAHVIRF